MNIDYSKYKDAYNGDIIKQWKEGRRGMDVNTLRAQLYGFTFTKDYAEGRVEEALSMDFWAERMSEDDEEPDIMFDADSDVTRQDEVMEAASTYEVDTPEERLLMEVIDSTGDGKTPDTALCVIDVGQEYEYLKRKFPYGCLKVKRQTLTDGIDCLYFEENVYDIKRIYFDVRRRFEAGYPNNSNPEYGE